MYICFVYYFLLLLTTRLSKCIRRRIFIWKHVRQIITTRRAYARAYLSTSHLAAIQIRSDHTIGKYRKVSEIVYTVDTRRTLTRYPRHNGLARLLWETAPYKRKGSLKETSAHQAVSLVVRPRALRATVTQQISNMANLLYEQNRPSCQSPRNLYLLKANAPLNIACWRGVMGRSRYSNCNVDCWRHSRQWRGQKRL